MKFTFNGVKAPIADGMMGLFFEDINYAADGGLYAELLENRSFAFVEAFGDKGDYYTKPDPCYAWTAYPSGEQSVIDAVNGSPVFPENPTYLRVKTLTSQAGFANTAYAGITLKAGASVSVSFYARNVKAEGKLTISIRTDDTIAASGTVEILPAHTGLPNHWNRYSLTLTAKQAVEKALFVVTLDNPGTMEFDHFSCMPDNAVCNVFRKDLWEKLNDLHPGFIRFPGGCIIEGNTLANRYDFKNTLAPWERRANNWNRWAVHNNKEENGYHSIFAHYNQTYGLGYYEYFLLCESLGAKPLPVLNVGMACQYQSYEFVDIEDPRFQDFVQDALDLIEFANGPVDSKWGAVRASLGHAEPFGLTMVGIGNEQWQLPESDFLRRYTIFEKAIHDRYPHMRLIGSAGPDVTSNHYTDAWEFYDSHADQENFVYAVDEHYYMRPQWFLTHADFYDNYPRTRKVFSGEYAAHPESGANTLEGALAEAAFLTGVEKNADVVVLSSYAPLFAREDFTQWRPDMIWFNDKISWGSPSYYVQKLFMNLKGSAVLNSPASDTSGVYYDGVLEASGDLLLRVVNLSDAPIQPEVSLDGVTYTPVHAWTLSGPDMQAVNSAENPDNVSVTESDGTGDVAVQTFAVIRLKKN